MKKFSFALMTIMIAAMEVVMSQPSLPSNPPQAPIDGGLGLLAAAGGAYARGAPVSVPTTRRKPGQSASPLKNQPSRLFSARKIAAVVQSAERANVPVSMTTMSGPAAAPTIVKSQEASAGQ